MRDRRDDDLRPMHGSAHTLIELAGVHMATLSFTLHLHSTYTASDNDET